jgi:hypothetical protein
MASSSSNVRRLPGRGRRGTDRYVQITDKHRRMLRMLIELEGFLGAGRAVGVS